MLRFNQVFFALMGMCLLSAFVLPVRVSSRGGVFADAIFVPISAPTYRLASGLRRRLDPAPAEDTREQSTIAADNLALKQEVSRLTQQVLYLQSLAGERQSLGSLQSLCDRVPVAGTDSGNRDGLVISGLNLGAVREKQPVLYSGGLVGQVDSVGAGAAHVQLLTDAGFTVTGQFIRFVNSGQAVRVGQMEPIVQGIGAGQMQIQNLSYSDVTAAGVAENDWVVLADNTWPQSVQGVRVARVASIDHLRKAPLFADIRLEPQEALMRLPDVYVMTRAEAR